MHIFCFDSTANSTAMQILISEDVGVPELREFPEYTLDWERRHPLRALKMYVGTLIRALFSR